MKATLIKQPGDFKMRPRQCHGYFKQFAFIVCLFHDKQAVVKFASNSKLTPLCAYFPGVYS